MTKQKHTLPMMHDLIFFPTSYLLLISYAPLRTLASSTADSYSSLLIAIFPLCSHKILSPKMAHKLSLPDPFCYTCI